MFRGVTTLYWTVVGNSQSRDGQSRYSTHTNSDWYLKTQSGISNSDTYFTCNTCVISIQHLYMIKYKYDY